MSIVNNLIITRFTYNTVCFYGPQRLHYNEVDLYIQTLVPLVQARVAWVSVGGVVVVVQVDAAGH